MGRAVRQSFQRYPLTAVLGTETNVRLLREFSRHGGQLPAASLVRRTGLAKGGVWNALAVLEEAGIVQSAGSGRVRLYRLRPDHPLREPIDRLFEAEEQRFAAIENAIRRIASEQGTGLLAVWLYGSVARGEDSAASDLDLAVVAEPAGEEGIVGGIREGLIAESERLGFSPSVVGLVPSDLERLARERDPWWETLIGDSWAIVGPSPRELLRHGAAMRKSRAA